MKISHLVAQAARPVEIPAPSPVHVAFVEMIGQLAALGLRSGHPAARLLERLAPSILRDLADVPASSLKRTAAQLARMMQWVADAPEVGDITVPDFAAEVAAIETTELPALPAPT